MCLLLGFGVGAVVQKLGTDLSRPWSGFIAFLSLIAVVSAAASVSARRRGLL